MVGDQLRRRRIVSLSHSTKTPSWLLFSIFSAPKSGSPLKGLKPIRGEATMSAHIGIIFCFFVEWRTTLLGGVWLIFRPTEKKGRCWDKENGNEGEERKIEADHWDTKIPFFTLSCLEDRRPFEEMTVGDFCYIVETGGKIGDVRTSEWKVTYQKAGNYNFHVLAKVRKLFCYCSISVLKF